MTGCYNGLLKYLSIEDDVIKSAAQWALLACRYLSLVSHSYTASDDIHNTDRCLPQINSLASIGLEELSKSTSSSSLIHHASRIKRSITCLKEYIVLIPDNQRIPFITARSDEVFREKHNPLTWNGSGVHCLSNVLLQAIVVDDMAGHNLEHAIDRGPLTEAFIFDILPLKNDLIEQMIDDRIEILSQTNNSQGFEDEFIEKHTCILIDHLLRKRRSVYSKGHINDSKSPDKSMHALGLVDPRSVEVGEKYLYLLNNKTNSIEESKCVKIF